MKFVYVWPMTMDDLKQRRFQEICRKAASVKGRFKSTQIGQRHHLGCVELQMDPSEVSVAEIVLKSLKPPHYPWNVVTTDTPADVRVPMSNVFNESGRALFRPDPDMSTMFESPIMMENLPEQLPIDALKILLPHATVMDMPVNHDNTNQGYAVAFFSTKDDATDSVERCRGVVLNSRKLRIYRVADRQDLRLCVDRYKSNNGHRIKKPLDEDKHKHDEDEQSGFGKNDDKSQNTPSKAKEANNKSDNRSSNKALSASRKSTSLVTKTTLAASKESSACIENKASVSKSSSKDVKSKKQLLLFAKLRKKFGLKKCCVKLIHCDTRQGELIPTHSCDKKVKVSKNNLSKKDLKQTKQSVKKSKTTDTANLGHDTKMEVHTGACDGDLLLQSQGTNDNVANTTTEAVVASTEVITSEIETTPKQIDGKGDASIIQMVGVGLASDSEVKDQGKVDLDINEGQCNMEANDSVEVGSVSLPASDRQDNDEGKVDTKHDNVNDSVNNSNNSTHSEKEANDGKPIDVKQDPVDGSSGVELGSIKVSDSDKAADDTQLEDNSDSTCSQIMSANKETVVDIEDDTCGTHVEDTSADVIEIAPVIDQEKTIKNDESEKVLESGRDEIQISSRKTDTICVSLKESKQLKKENFDEIQLSTSLSSELHTSFDMNLSQVKVSSTASNVSDSNKSEISDKQTFSNTDDSDKCIDVTLMQTDDDQIEVDNKTDSIVKVASDDLAVSCEGNSESNTTSAEVSEKCIVEGTDLEVTDSTNINTPEEDSNTNIQVGKVSDEVTFDKNEKVSKTVKSASCQLDSKSGLEDKEMTRVQLSTDTDTAIQATLKNVKKQSKKFKAAKTQLRKKAILSASLANASNDTDSSLACHVTLAKMSKANIDKLSHLTDPDPEHVVLTEVDTEASSEVKPKKAKAGKKRPNEKELTVIDDGSDISEESEGTSAQTEIFTKKSKIDVSIKKSEAFESDDEVEFKETVQDTPPVQEKRKRKAAQTKAPVDDTKLKMSRSRKKANKVIEATLDEELTADSTDDSQHAEATLSQTSFEVSSSSESQEIDLALPVIEKETKAKPRRGRGRGRKR